MKALCVDLAKSRRRLARPLFFQPDLSSSILDASSGFELSMSTLATHHPTHAAGFSTSSQSSPSSPSFPHHQPPSSTGTAFHLNLRPGTSSGTISSPTLPPPTDSSGLDYATLPSWSDQHVATWISHSLPTLSSAYADVFAQNDIRGNVLLEVDQTALKEMGVRSVGDRVKICVAVRALRGKYIAAIGGGINGGGNRVSVLLSRFTHSRPSSPLGQNSITLSPPGSTILSTPPGSAMTVNLPPTAQGVAPLVDSRPGSGSYSARNISVGNRIPPPLHLAQSNVTSPLAPTQLQQAHYNNTVSPPSRTTSPRTGQFTTSSSSSSASSAPSSSTAPTSNSSRQKATLPPALPPPNSRIPATPSNSRDWLGEIPGYKHSNSNASSSNNSSNPPHSLAGSASNAQLRPSTATTRHKASSSSLSARPSTAQASLSSYAGHPYAAQAQSQTQLLPSPLEHPSSAKSDSHQGYTVGRSTFARPSTAGGLVSSSGVIASSVSSTPLSNLDVMRKAVKFTSADGVTTRVLAVGDAKDGREVLSRVVRKFSTSGGGSVTPGSTGALSKDEDLDGWGIWTPDQNGMGKALSCCFSSLLRESILTNPPTRSSSVIRTGVTFRLSKHGGTRAKSRSLRSKTTFLRFRSFFPSAPHLDHFPIYRTTTNIFDVPEQARSKVTMGVWRISRRFFRYASTWRRSILHSLGYRSRFRESDGFTDESKLSRNRNSQDGFRTSESIYQWRRKRLRRRDLPSRGVRC